MIEEVVDKWILWAKGKMPGDRAETLETLLIDAGHARPGNLRALRDGWEAAYLSTPHGEPVHLKAGPSV